MGNFIICPAGGPGGGSPPEASATPAAQFNKSIMESAQCWKFVENWNNFYRKIWEKGEIFKLF